VVTFDLARHRRQEGHNASPNGEPDIDRFNDDRTLRALTYAQLIGVQNKVEELVLWMLLIFILYLVSLYSAVAALCIALPLAIGSAVSAFAQSKRLQRLIGTIYSRSQMGW